MRPTLFCIVSSSALGASGASRSSTEAGPPDPVHEMAGRAIPEGVIDVLMFAFSMLQQNGRRAVLEQSRKRLLCYGVRAPAAERDTPHLSASADMGGNKIDLIVQAIDVGSQPRFSGRCSRIAPAIPANRPAIGDVQIERQDFVRTDRTECCSHVGMTHMIAEFGGGVAAPSANRFGRVSTTTAQHVAEELGDRVDYVLDGGASDIGIESTIIDARGSVPVLMRPGHISVQAIAAAAGVAVEASRADREQRLLTVRARLRDLQRELDELVNSVHRDEMARAQQRMRIEQLEMRAMEEFGIAPEVPDQNYFVYAAACHKHL